MVRPRNSMEFRTFWVFVTASSAFTDVTKVPESSTNCDICASIVGFFALDFEICSSKVFIIMLNIIGDNTASCGQPFSVISTFEVYPLY